LFEKGEEGMQLARLFLAGEDEPRSIGEMDCCISNELTKKIN
jgi:hypothetical protein